VGLQLALGVALMNPWISAAFSSGIDALVNTLIGFSAEGARFLFASFVPHFVTVMDEVGQPVQQDFANQVSPSLMNIAFWVLPTIIFFSALMTLLYHLGWMQRIVSGVAWAMQRTMKTSGGETLSAAANIFVGQTEAPLLVKPFVHSMTRSELMAVMVGGFATVAGGVMAVYVLFLHEIPGIAGHLAMASIMSAPAALAIAKVIVPETEVSATAGGTPFAVEKLDTNAVEAVSRGALDGMRLAANVAAMLIAFVAMVAMVNWAFGLFGLSFDQVLGWLFSPLAYAIGIPWEEAPIIGQLLGKKMVLTELIAYSSLRDLMMSGVPVLSERSAVIASYALCGFANFASIGIQIGGIGGIAPERRSELAELGLRAMLGGTIAALMTAAVAGVLL
jgi:CNT family concentrative nucleoside transporter